MLAAAAVTTCTRRGLLNHANAAATLVVAAFSSAPSSLTLPPLTSIANNHPNKSSLTSSQSSIWLTTTTTRQCRHTHSSTPAAAPTTLVDSTSSQPHHFPSSTTPSSSPQSHSWSQITSRYLSSLSSSASLPSPPLHHHMRWTLEQFPIFSSSSTSFSAQKGTTNAVVTLLPPPEDITDPSLTAHAGIGFRASVTSTYSLLSHPSTTSGLAQVEKPRYIRPSSASPLSSQPKGLQYLANMDTSEWYEQLIARGIIFSRMVSGIVLDQLERVLLREVKELTKESCTKLTMEEMRQVVADVIHDLTMDHIGEYNWIVMEHDPQTLYLPLSSLPAVVQLVQQRLTAYLLHNHHKLNAASPSLLSSTPTTDWSPLTGWQWSPRFLERLISPYCGVIGRWQFRHFRDTNDWQSYIVKHASHDIRQARQQTIQQLAHIRQQLQSAALPSSSSPLAANFRMAAIDCEMHEGTPKCLLEIGVSICQPRGSSSSTNHRGSSGVVDIHPYNDKYEIVTYHWVIKDHADKVNGRYVPNHKHNFNFGSTLTVDHEDAIVQVKQVLTGVTHVIGAGMHEDIRILLGQGVTEVAGKGVTRYDIQHINRTLWQPSRRVRLHSLCKHHRIQSSHLHNAGNDAHYSMMVFLHQCHLHHPTHAE